MIKADLSVHLSDFSIYIKDVCEMFYVLSCSAVFARVWSRGHTDIHTRLGNRYCSQLLAHEFGTVCRLHCKQLKTANSSKGF